MTRSVASKSMLGVLCVTCLVAVSLAQVQLKDPSVCDGAKMKNSIGYNPHPRDCSQFVQCFYVARKGMADKVVPVYRNCEYGTFWDHDKVRCLPSYRVQCKNDLCRRRGVAFYKHKDPNRCVAYYECVDGKATARCCPKGQGFHPRQGCINSESCKDLCPFEDRIPGTCHKKPISGAPTKYEQYTDNGRWVTERCPSGRMFSAPDCDCSIKGLVKVGRVCKPDVKLTFNDGQIRDVSGNNNKVVGENVQPYKGSLYFRGTSKLLVQPLNPSKYDEGHLIIKFKIKENKRKAYGQPRQILVTNGHCPGNNASVLIGKVTSRVGKEIKTRITMGSQTEKMFSLLNLPLVKTAGDFKDIIYVFDKEKIEGRSCGAAARKWCVGDLKPTQCGFQFGFDEIKGYNGYIGLMDDIEIYRCKPLDAVINIDY